MAEKSRILVFTTAFRPMIGGSEIALEEVINRLPDIFFDIITPKYTNKLSSKEFGGNKCVYRIGFGWGSLDKIMFPVLGFLKVMVHLRSNKYLKVQAYQASYGGGAVWLLKLFFPKLEFILTIQEGKNLNRQNVFIKFFRRLIVKKADTITCISSYLADYAKKINHGAKILVIPNGVDLRKFEVKSEKLKNDEKTIITISRLVKKNGVGDLIDAFHILSSKFQAPSFKLLIVGDGPFNKSLKLKAESLKLSDKILFVGEISSDDISKYLIQADVFVRPSLSEGLGTAFLEAMAVGVPVIGTPVGGIPDFLKDPSTHSGQATGLFCRVNDPEDLSEKIENILTDDELRSRLILNARKLVEEKYNWDIIAARFRDLYLKQ